MYNFKKTKQIIPTCNLNDKDDLYIILYHRIKLLCLHESWASQPYLNRALTHFINANVYKTLRCSQRKYISVWTLHCDKYFLNRLYVLSESLKIIKRYCIVETIYKIVVKLVNMFKVFVKDVGLFSEFVTICNDEKLVSTIRSFM